MVKPKERPVLRQRKWTESGRQGFVFSTLGFHGPLPWPYQKERAGEKSILRDFLKVSFKSGTKSSSLQLLLNLRFSKSGTVFVLWTSSEILERHPGWSHPQKWGNPVAHCPISWGKKKNSRLLLSAIFSRGLWQVDGVSFKWMHRAGACWQSGPSALLFISPFCSFLIFTSSPYSNSDMSFWLVDLVEESLPPYSQYSLAPKDCHRLAILTPIACESLGAEVPCLCHCEVLLRYPRGD